MVARNNTRHLKPLDGIRGIAVLMVICFHYGYFAAGWVGVQIFFTLSGYLITTILLSNRSSSPSSYFGIFYWHRALRILPVVYALMLVCGVVYVLSSQPSSFGSDWPWLVAFSGNFARMRQSDLGSSFVHLWSLAVEQQFYLIWPFLIFILPPRGFRAAVVVILIFTPAVRYVLFQHLIGIGYTSIYAGKATYVLPFTQFDAFAAGAAIPLWSLDKMRNPGRWFNLTLAATALAGFSVLISQYFWGKGAFIASFGFAMYLIQDYGYVWGYSLLNLLSMLGIVCAIQRIGPTPILANGPLVWIGKISYGAYVYQLPLLRVAEAILNHLGIEIVGIIKPIVFVSWVALVFLISDISFRWLEQPFLKLKHYWNKDTRLAQPMGS